MILRSLRRADRFAVECDHPFLGSFGTVGTFRNDHVQIVGKREDAAVEQLVMHRAKDS